MSVGAASLLVACAPSAASTRSRTAPALATVQAAPATATGARARGSGYRFKALPCDQLPAPDDTVETTVYLSLDAPLLARPLPPGYADSVLRALAGVFVAPQPVQSPVFGTTGGARVPAPVATQGPLPPEVPLHPTVNGEVEFTLDQAGYVSRVLLTTATLSRALDERLTALPARAESLHVFPVREGPVSLAGGIRFFAALGTVHPVGVPSVPLFVLRVPQWRQAELAQRTSAAPEAGDAASGGPGGVSEAARHREDSVVVQFVVDEIGHPVLSTVQLVDAHYRAFARAALESLRQSTFMPASIDGCAVKQVALESYHFMIAQ